jgi:hypothetical protein
MNKETLQIVSFEQALRLKEIGWNWKTKKIARRRSLGFYMPEVALALKWLRNTKQLRHDGGNYCVDNNYRFWWTYQPGLELEGWQVTKYYDTYDEAECALLYAVLDFFENSNQ